MQGNNIGSTSISELPITNNVGIVNQEKMQPTMQSNMQPTMQSNMQPTMQSNMQPTMQPNMQPTMQPTREQNVNINITDKNVNDQVAYNELVGQIQQADKLGVTQLPSRDIPNNTDNIVMDNQTNPNYIPEQEIMEDYIKNYETPANVIQDEENKKNINNRIEDLYSTIQMPLLVSLLYFIFNLPVIRKYMFKYIPNLFGNDGNPNILGYVVNSIIFGILFYILNNIINNIIYS